MVFLQDDGVIAPTRINSQSDQNGRDYGEELAECRVSSRKV